MTSQTSDIDEVHALLDQAESCYETDRHRARTLAASALSASRKLNDTDCLAHAADLNGRLHQSFGSLASAKELLEEGLRLRRASDDHKGIGQSLRNLANLARWMGDFDHAEALIRESIAIFAELREPDELAHSVRTLEGVLVYGGRFADSLRLSEDPALRDIDEALLPRSSPPSFVSFFARMHLGQYDDAQKGFEAALANFPKGAGGYAAKNIGRIELARGNYAKAQTHLLQALARFRESENLNGLGQALGCLGITSLQLGEVAQARAYILENLQVAAQTLIILPSMTALTSRAYLDAVEGRLDSAHLLYTAARQSGHVANSLWYQTVIGRYIESAAEELPPSQLQAARVGGKNRTWQAILSELHGA